MSTVCDRVSLFANMGSSTFAALLCFVLFSCCELSFVALHFVLFVWSDMSSRTDLCL